jgi:hypothetical protein
MIHKILLFISVLILTTAINAQNNPTLISADCSGAIKININKSVKQIYTAIPNGFGKVQEIKAKNATDKTAFEKEHNSAWYMLNIERDGELVMDVLPQDSTNDYDFLIYKYTDVNFCNDLLTKKIAPLRSNLSKNNIKTNGKTGLSASAKNDFTGKDSGDNYSKALPVKKGEQYLLVLNNVSEKGKAYNLNFNYLMDIIIKGTITNLAKHPLDAELILKDEKNNTISQTIADKKTGNYQFTVRVKADAFYSLVISASHYLPEAAYVNTRLLKLTENTFIINKQLTELKVGETYPLMYYEHMGQGFYLYETWPPFFILGNLIEKNKTMKMQIEIHAASDEIKRWDEGVSGTLDRTTLPAHRVRNFKAELNNLHISPTNLTILPTDKAIIENAKTEEEKRQNRAVTLKILSL